MKPLQIKVLDKKFLLIKWDEKSESKIGLKYLRDECPCANCKGETQNIQLVGGYAIQVSWKDGHNTGIYSWEYLQQLAKDEQTGQSQNYDSIL